MGQEMMNTRIRFDSKPEEINEIIASCIQDYRLKSLCLWYERKDNLAQHTASFTFWLSGTDLAGEELTLLHVQELPANFSSFVEQIRKGANEMNVSFENKFEQDGYTVHWQAIHRRIERGR